MIFKYCGKMGHEVDKCFQKHGFPDWYLEQTNRGCGAGRGTGRGAGRGSGRGADESRGRGKMNEFARGSGRANAVHTTSVGEIQREQHKKLFRP